MQPFASTKKKKTNKTVEKPTVGNTETTQKEVGVIFKPLTMKRFFIFCTSLFLSFSLAKAQYVEIPLDQRVGQSDLIVEARVIDQFCYKKDGLIYTANQIEVCDVIYQKILPLAENQTDTYVITYGGEFEGEFCTWTHMLTLSEGMEGLFFLRYNNSITPDTIPDGSRFYEVYSQEQGFLAFSKDDNWNFAGNSLIERVTDIDDYINQINELTEQSSVTQSCLLDNKSGIVLRVDTAILDQENLSFETSLKGQWSKGYNLQKVKIQIQFAGSTNLSSYDFLVSPRTSSIQNNYQIAWSQPTSTTAELVILKNTATTVYEQLDSDFSEFVEISFHSSLLTVGIKSVQISETSFKDGSEVHDFQEHEIFYNKVVKDFFATPDITSFEPAEVCAGIKADLSSGVPTVEGYVIIKGTNFGDVSPANFPTEIPNNYRVEFIREQQLNTTSFKVTPMPDDYEYWTDTEIKVRVPTAGWLVNNNNIISGPEPSNAVTGRITVRNPDGNDHTGDDKLVVRFAQFDAIENLGSGDQAFPRKLIDRSGNGGYYFIFDSSFDNIYPSNPAAARQDIIDAFCEWNLITDAKLEVVTTCPTGAMCFNIRYANIPSTGGGTVALAAGESLPNFFNCSNEAVITVMLLTYNTQITDWKPSSEANPLVDDHIIKTSAYHEIGHLLQLGHVYNDGSLMHPFYDSGDAIDTDARAGGTHVSNVSAATACPAPLAQGVISGCMTPTIEPFKDNWVRLSPNPVKNWLQLEFESDISDYQVEIYDVLGHLKTSGAITSSIQQIDVSNLPVGTYLLVIKDGTLSKSIKFTKI
jgi:type IX secretion system substrate protein